MGLSYLFLCVSILAISVLSTRMLRFECAINCGRRSLHHAIDDSAFHPRRHRRRWYGKLLVSPCHRQTFPRNCFLQKLHAAIDRLDSDLKQRVSNAGGYECSNVRRAAFSPLLNVSLYKTHLPKHHCGDVHPSIMRWERGDVVEKDNGWGKQ